MLEFCEGGSLRDHVQPPKDDEYEMHLRPFKLSVALDVARAMAHCHDRANFDPPIIHRARPFVVKWRSPIPLVVCAVYSRIYLGSGVVLVSWMLGFGFRHAGHQGR